MVMFHTAIDVPASGNAEEATITITFKPPRGDTKSMQMPLVPDTTGLDILDVTMHNSPTKAHNMGSKYNEWLGECLGFKVVLAYLGNNTRKVLMSTNGNAQKQDSWMSTLTSNLPTAIGNLVQEKQEQITFSDCAPYLVVSDTSLTDVSRRLPDGQDMDITKFRPNIIVHGADTAWDEDYWAELSIGNVNLQLVQNCARCQSINIDYATGKPGTDDSGKVLKKMQSDRRVDAGAKYSPIFGRYCFLPHVDVGKSIGIGDEVLITKRNTERTTFGRSRTRESIMLVLTT